MANLLVAYTMKGCHWCTEFKKQLKENKIKFNVFIIYPFGAPEGKMGIVETFTPAWASRILYGLGMDSYEAKNVSTLRPLMAYLASTGEYGDFPLDGQAQAALLEDAGRVNRVLALWRGITQNLSPGAIAPQILAKDKTGEFHVQALMFNDFVQIRANSSRFGRIYYCYSTCSCFEIKLSL